MIGYIDSIESFGLVDGPGVRSIIFLCGCPFRCLYCHNPEMWSGKGKMQLTPEEAYKLLKKFKPYWKDNGGITISGGEPLVQLEFVTELAKLAKKDNINVTIDTSGAPFSNDSEYLIKFDELLKYVDLFLLDVKAVNNEKHIKITGKSNTNVKNLFHYLNEKDFPIWVRYVLVPGLTDSDEDLENTRDFLMNFKNIKRIEVLPYHSLMIPKYEKLGIKYPLKDVQIPTKNSIKHSENILGMYYNNKRTKKEK